MVKPHGSYFGHKDPVTGLPRPRIVPPPKAVPPKGSLANTNIELKREIMSIVDAHSGGLKMMELIPELVIKFPITAGLVESAISEMENYHILEYEWELEEGAYRAKQFVYFKKSLDD